jgi:hypothetical protein
VFTGAALALLTALLLARVHLSGTWIDRAWVFLTAPMSLQAAIVWTGYFARRRTAAMDSHWKTPSIPHADGIDAQSSSPPSESPINVDLVALERELWAESPPEIERREGAVGPGVSESLPAGIQTPTSAI